MNVEYKFVQTSRGNKIQSTEMIAVHDGQEFVMDTLVTEKNITDLMSEIKGTKEYHEFMWLMMNKHK